LVISHRIPININRNPNSSWVNPPAHEPKSTQDELDAHAFVDANQVGIAWEYHGDTMGYSFI
jgi:hypothetical protein